MYIYIIGLLLSLGAGIWFIYQPPKDKTSIILLLSAGGAFLITILFTHILPELFEELGYQAGIVLLIGFGIQILLENYSRGIEHGHAHPSKSTGKLTIAYIALCIHALIEGMPLAPALFNSVVPLENQFIIGVMVHKIPVAVALSSVLIKSNVSKNQALIWLLGFIACTLVGSSFQQFLASQLSFDSGKLMFITLGLTVGILLHVSTTILFESSDQHRLSPTRLVAIAIGVALGVLG